MFPRGAPGFALLLLRISIAVSIVLNVGIGAHREVWVLAPALALSAVLFVGFLTPIAAVFAIPVYLIETKSHAVASAEVLAAVLQAIALSLLGPGSCSIDAYLFGHRVVVLPEKNDRDES